MSQIAAAIPRPSPGAIELRCPAISTAREIRERWGAFCHVSERDLRFRTVWLYEDTPKFYRDRIKRKIALDTPDETQKFGQSELTRLERQKLYQRDGWNYGRKGFHARSVKAIANGLGVDDWIARYDHTVSTDTHRDLFMRISGEGGRRGTMRRMHNEERDRYNDK